MDGQGGYGALDKATSLNLPNETGDGQYTEIPEFNINNAINIDTLLEADDPLFEGDDPLENVADIKKRAASFISSESEATAHKENQDEESTFGPTSTFPTDEEVDAIKEAFEAARSNSRMKDTKADSIRLLLQSGLSSQEIIIGLFDEFIPKKRTKKGADGEDRPTEGYGCRICHEPIKGHVCPYCEICSTSEDKYIKDGDHVCFNCPKCYFEAKKKKKLVQVLLEDCKCSVACKEVDVDKMEHYEEV